MDYFAEIAESPEIEEALKHLAGNPEYPEYLMRPLLPFILSPDHNSQDAYNRAMDIYTSAKKSYDQQKKDKKDDRGKEAEPKPPLRSKYFPLFETYPSIWRTELINWFHLHPAFAAAVWLKCERMMLARRVGVLPWHEEFKGLDENGAPLRQTLECNATTSRQQFIEKLFAATDKSLDKVRCKIKKYSPGPDFIERLVELKEENNHPIRKCIEFCLPHIKSLRLSLKKTSINEIKQAYDLIADPDKACDLAKKYGVPVPFSMVLDEELKQINECRDARRNEQEMSAQNKKPSEEQREKQGSGTGGEKDSYCGLPIRKALECGLVGLAFSGGGIRSATFNLGVLQALARLDILRQCDYLSTVSGGGYIGSWFTAWTHREGTDPLTGNQRTAAQVQDRMRQLLSPTRSPDPLDKDVRPIRYLREFSNYLTPQSGFLSADTWTMLAIYLRNFLLNLVVLLPFIAAVLIAPRLVFSWPALRNISVSDTWMYLLIIAIPPLLILVLNIRRASPPPNFDEEDQGPEVVPLYAQQGWIQILVVVPLLIIACLTALSYRTYILPGLINRGHSDELIFEFSRYAGFVFFGYLLIIHVAGWFMKFWPGKPWTAIWSVIFATCLTPVAAFGLFWVIGNILWMFAAQKEQEVWLTLTFGTSLILVAYSLIVAIQLGLLGTEFPDEQREWWSRLRAWTLIHSLVWMALFTFAMWVPYGIDELLDERLEAVGGIGALGVWALSTYLGIRAGRTNESAANISDRSSPNSAGESGPSRGKRTKHLILLSAPYIFVVGLLAMVSLGVLYLLRWYFQTNFSWQLFPRHSLLGIIIGLVFLSIVFSLRIGVNEFSMHHFYKNRLVRCYLGASRWQFRKADWFTGFDSKDNFFLSYLDHVSCGDSEGPKYWGPYPIVNTALNLAAGGDLAWQERKATSFVFTPKYCGYDVDRAVLQRGTDSVWPDGYAPTRSFISRGTGPTLGSAMAISGAAANPNMGKMTTAASAFLMTVFNARLGWWVPNSRRKNKWWGWDRRGPALGITYTGIELFGMTDDQKKFVNLSDGGHFENLGVYELIRRGCRYVIVSDAGQDGSFSFEDLGNLIRKCRTDFGVEINIGVDMIKDRNPKGWSDRHCVVGKIRYLTIPKRINGHVEYDENGQPKPEEGWLLYMKPTITGDEPADVQEYYQRVPEFPHESTADQWFNESQFESYRRLGLHIAEKAFGRFREHPDTETLDSEGKIKDLFENLRKHWHPPSHKVGEHSTDHAMEYTRLMELIRGNRNLAFLDPALFESIKNAPLSLTGTRDEFYICNAFIQLIENVYADLDLEENHAHPHVEGWMKVFKFWAKEAPFKRTWKVSQGTYATRFQKFYEDRLEK